MTYNGPVFEFIETPFFTKAALRYLSDDKYAGKHVRETIPAHVLKQIKEAIEDEESR